MQNYSDYLSSSHWKETRGKRLEIDEYKCAVCGSTENLNVHHLSYKRIGNEDIESDLITLCHPCHAMLHRIKEQSEEEYEIARESEKTGQYKEARVKSLWKKICDLLTVEIWLRDRANGGDIDTWDTGGGMIGKLKTISKKLYSDINFSNDCLYSSSDIKDQLRLARAMKICELYREENSVSAVAEKMNMKPSNVQKVLKRHGFNATGKIR